MKMCSTVRRIGSFGIAGAFALSAGLLGGVGAACATQAVGQDASGQAQVQQGEQVFVDLAGTELVVPASISSVADLWPAHNQIMMLLGQADAIVQTADATAGNAWVAKVFPQLASVPSNKTNEPGGIEEMMALNPDITFTSSKDVAAQLNEKGVACAFVTYSSFDEMVEVAELTATLFGDEAQQKAVAFGDYLNANIDRVKAAIADVDEADKQTVLYINDFGVSYGKNTIVDEWIAKAGGINAFTGEKPEEVSIEGIAAMNPDVLLVSKAKYDEITGDPALADLDAIKAGRVYVCPTGTFSWSQYGAESALQVLWTAQLLYPELLADVDMVSEVQDFYKQFFDYELSAEDAQRILDCEDPA